MRARWRYVIIAAILLIAAGIVLAFMLADKPPAAPPVDDARAERPERALPSVVDSPTPPPATDIFEGRETEASSGDTGDGQTTSHTSPSTSTAAARYRAYLASTAAVVRSNSDDLQAASAAVLAAIKAGDGATLAGLIAPDEGAQTPYANDLAGRYPQITGSTLMPTVNVFAAGRATIYITYAQVVWTDAGMTSQHTIPMALRFVNGEWYLTVWDDSTPDLLFVQSVAL